MADPLVDVAVRVYADYAEHATLAEVLAVVAKCRSDLDTPSAAALPELVERLARQRLADDLAARATGNGAHPAGSCFGEPTGATEGRDETVVRMAPAKSPADFRRGVDSPGPSR